jgi:tRNA(Ile)-lysidine synthase
MADLGAPWPGAVAVSGGGDSLALMHLLRGWAKDARVAPPVVLTVDHGLQQGSVVNARKVLAWAKKAGLKAHRLVWKGTKPATGVEAAAREARYALMGAWCRAQGIGALYVGHTSDDQAETFLLRLARGSGLDGLSAMRPLAPYPLAQFRELAVARPLIAVERQALRDHLCTLGQGWLDDPMNEDPRFGRVRVRSGWLALEAMGLTRERLADAAAHLGRAREALDMVTDAVLARVSRSLEGAILIDPVALTAAPREIGLRALARLLMVASGQVYRPRFDRLERLFDAIAQGRIGAGATLHGCKIAPAPRSKAGFGPGTLTIVRERPHRLQKGTKSAVRRRTSEETGF